jgi:hypothetical protein
MKFTEYRSKCLKAMWKGLKEHATFDYVTRQPHFSTWRVDDICANQWRASDTDITGCVQELIHYIKAEVLLIC